MELPNDTCFMTDEGILICEVGARHGALICLNPNTNEPIKSIPAVNELKNLPMNLSSSSEPTRITSWTG